MIKRLFLEAEWLKVYKARIRAGQQVASRHRGCGRVGEFLVSHPQFTYYFSWHTTAGIYTWVNNWAQEAIFGRFMVVTRPRQGSKKHLCKCMSLDSADAAKTVEETKGNRVVLGAKGRNNNYILVLKFDQVHFTTCLSVNRMSNDWQTA